MASERERYMESLLREWYTATPEKEWEQFKKRVAHALRPESVWRHEQEQRKYLNGLRGEE